MSSAQAVVAFTLSAGLLTITPGLDTALVLRTAAAEGRRRGMLAGIGICSGVLVWGASAAAGLAALLALSQYAYDVLRFVGAGYLMYLGIRLIIRPRRQLDLSQTAPQDAQSSPAIWFGRGVLTNLLNPKVGVFYISFLPQFIPTTANVFWFSMLLATIHAIEGVVWFLLLCEATDALGNLVRRPRVIHALDRLTGGVFVVFGVKLALDRR